MGNSPDKVQRGKWVFKDGKWDADAKPSVRELPEDLRKLPGEIVTQDELDPDKIHELDPDHIKNDAIRRYNDAEAADKGVLPYKSVKMRDRDVPASELLGQKLAKFLEYVPTGEHAPLNQARIDAVRFRVLQTVIESACRAAAEPGAQISFKVSHIWFPRDDVSDYELRVGVPPPPSERPKHLRRYDLVLDIRNFPRRVEDAFQAAGFPLPRFDEVQPVAEQENAGCVAHVKNA